MLGIIDWAIFFLSKAGQASVRAIFYEGKAVKEHGAAADAARLAPACVDGRPTGKRVEVCVSYVGECGVEEAVSRHLAARQNARTLGAAGPAER